MSDLTFIEKRQYEALFEMGSGYVLDFSDRTFDEFVADSVAIDIRAEPYSGSKANRLRTFWRSQTNYLVGKLMQDMVRYAATINRNVDRALVTQCEQIADRLLKSAPVPEIDVIAPNAPGRSFETLAKSVRESIEKNEPEAGLDRLHTFVVKYIRTICESHGLPVEKDKPLHSMFGEYLKCLKREGKVISQMTERILKSSISTLEAFNDIRNNRSFAHDNEILGYEESLLIFNHVTALIRFILSIEMPTVPEPIPTSTAPNELSFCSDEEIPF